MKTLLAKAFHLDETEEPQHSLMLKIKLQTTDTSELKLVNVLLDSGATKMFIDRDYINAN